VLRARESSQRRHRPHHDDRAAAGRPQVRNAVLGHPEDGFEIDRHHAIPPLLIRFQHRAVPVFPQHTRVVVEHVQRAKFPHPLRLLPLPAPPTPHSARPPNPRPPRPPTLLPPPP